MYVVLYFAIGFALAVFAFSNVKRTWLNYFGFTVLWPAVVFIAFWFWLTDQDLNEIVSDDEWNEVDSDIHSDGDQ